MDPLGKQVGDGELDAEQAALAGKIFEQGVHYRTLLVGRNVENGSEVAACLCRAIRNLGHHVLALDLGRHRDLLEEPAAKLVAETDSVSAIHALAFDRICAKFFPQIIVLCGTGLALAPAHAERLKQQGIVLIGLTLVATKDSARVPLQAQQFDFHICNSHKELSIYHSSGLHNTLYLPLALDRSAITSSAARSQKIRAKAYKRIVSGHLYEHRCMRLIESIFNCSLDTTPWLAEARIQSIRNTLTQSLPRCKQVICSGFYGASNLGDELILRSIATALQASDAAVQVVVAAENPVAVEREHGLPAFHGKNLNEALHHVRTASAIIVGGGGLWHDYSFERSGGLTGIFQEPQLSMASFATLPIMGRFFNTPCHVLGMGVGPITTPDALRMLRFVAGLADTIQVRDEASLALLTKAGVKPGKANMAPDLVYALTLPPVQPAPALVQLKTEGYTLVAINLRPWAFGDQSALFASVAQALHLLSQTAKLAIVTIPMQTSDNATLSSFVANWCAELKHVMLQAPLSQEELLSTLMVVDLVLAMRLHTCLVAHRLHKPVVGLAYDPKVANHFAQLTRTQFAIALDTQATKIFDTVNLVLKTQWTSESQQQLTSLEAEARAALAIATHRIAALPRVNEVFEEHRDVATIRGELNDLRTLQKLNIGG